jgi:hypothetical protein
MKRPPLPASPYCPACGFGGWGGNTNTAGTTECTACTYTDPDDDDTERKRHLSLVPSTGKRRPRTERRGGDATYHASGHDPRQLLAYLATCRSAPANPTDRLLGHYANLSSTRDPYKALLSLRARRIRSGW